MPDNILLYVVFLSQILLISYYFPKKMLSRIKLVFETYPPSQYPNLYPEPFEKYEKGLRNYRYLNLFILLVGLSLLVVIIGYPGCSEWDLTHFVFPYFMVQFFPIILIEIKSFKYYQLMRLNDTRTSRKAELHPRRLFDFVSPKLIGMAVLVYIAFIFFILYVRQFDYQWFGGYGNIVGVTAMNLYFAGVIIWNMYGKKLNPYQDYEDRKWQIKHTVKQMVFVSIAATLYIIHAIVLAILDILSLQPVTMSLYFQLIAAVSLQTLRIGSINFEVYKKRIRLRKVVK